MKVTPMFLIICLAMFFLLIGIGCKQPNSAPAKQQPKPESAKQQPKPEPTMQQPEPKSMQKATTGMRQPLSAGQNTFALSADPEKEPLEGFLPPEDSKKWLKDNHFQVRARAEDYIIICNYYDPRTKSRYNSRSEILRGSRVSISGPASAVVTIDKQGQLRVAPINTQE